MPAGKFSFYEVFGDILHFSINVFNSALDKFKIASTRAFSVSTFASIAFVMTSWSVVLALVSILASKVSISVSAADNQVLMVLICVWASELNVFV